MMKKAVREVLSEERQANGYKLQERIEQKSSNQTLTRRELSKKFKLSLVSIYKLMKSGKIPFHRMGDRKLLFYEDEIIEAFPKIQNRGMHD
jgi:excisionase family DNA binding protein